MTNNMIVEKRGLNSDLALILVSMILALLWNSPALGASNAYTFTTFAGPAGAGTGAVDGTGSAARFGGPHGVAVDASRNVYMADFGYNTIRKITSAGVVTTLAGTTGLQGSADGTGSAARFYYPSGVAVDASGNVYVADSLNNTIRKITSAGVVTTLAGTAGTFGSTDGTGGVARFSNPYDVAVDESGNVYVADSGNNTIRKITSDGVVTTLAGTAGMSGSADGPGSAASFSNPYGLAVDASGNVYVADTGNETISNNTIRKITSAGVVTTLAGTAGISGSADGIGSAARFNFPAGVAVDASGNVYVADLFNNTVRKITSVAVVTTLAGTGKGGPGSVDGAGSAARFNQPTGVAVDASGNVYVADQANNTIRKITPAGVVTTLAGTVGVIGSADGTGSAALFKYPDGVAIDASGNVYVADSYNYTVRKITSAGVVTTLAGAAGLYGSADGTGSAARFNFPAGVAVDASGNVYVADSNTIRKITSAGVVTTLAGTAGLYGSADGTGSAARFNASAGVAVDASGNVYVADKFNYTIRKMTPVGVVTTVVGTAGLSGSADGTGSAALFNGPTGVAVDAFGNVYVADSTIRKITSGNVVSTLAGSVGLSGNADGTGNAARFEFPYGITADTAGNVYVADYSNNNIRFGTPTLVDLATIDTATGLVGAVRQLNTAPQTATSISWSFIRYPSASMATLSSATIANPTFTPDVADLFIFQLVATSASGSSITTVSLMGVTTPTITSTLSAGGVVGSGFSYTITANGSPTIAFTASALPAGLTLAGATISGTPTAAGSTNVTLIAANGTSPNDTQTLVITIVAPPPPTITSSLTASATQGQPFSYQITASNNPESFEVLGLPDGLIVNAAGQIFGSSTGLISGSSTLAGMTGITILAGNAGGIDTQMLVLTVAPAAGAAAPAAPQFQWPLSAAPVQAGIPVFLSASVGTKDSLVLVTWDFGDGTIAIGDTVIHTFNSAGVYQVKVTLNNGSSTTTTQTLDVAVDPSVATFYNFIQFAKGTVSFNFKTQKDMMTLAGTVLKLPVQFAPSGKALIVAMGDFELHSTLNNKGKSADKSFSLKGKLQKGIFQVTAVKFQLALKNQALFTKLSPFGFVNGDLAKPGREVQVPVVVSIDGNGYVGTAQFTYMAKKGKTGTGKF